MDDLGHLYPWGNLLIFSLQKKTSGGYAWPTNLREPGYRRKYRKVNLNMVHTVLLGGWTTHLKKYDRHIGSFSLNRDEHKKCLKPPPPSVWCFRNPKKQPPTVWMVLKPLVNSWDVYNLPTTQLVSWSRISAINLMERSTSHGRESYMSYVQRWHDEQMGGRTCRGPLPPKQNEAFFPDHDVPFEKVGWFLRGFLW